MNLPDVIHSFFRAPQLTRARVVGALLVAAGADGLQLFLTPLGWFGLVQAIDFLAMVIVSRLIGFHVLLLPTFVVELVPVIDALPTWTACTSAVIVLRKREQSRTPPPATPPPGAAPEKPAIDI